MRLEKSLKFLEDSPEISEKLESVYSEVAVGNCMGCLKCCTESVNTFFVEYVHILGFLRNNPQVLLNHADKISRFFLLEMVEEMHCPFVREDGKCAIYPMRPLPCRVFGHLKKEDYQVNYEQVLASNEDLATYYEQKHGLTIPRAIIERKIPYCQDFVSEEKMNVDDRDDLVDWLFSLDSKFLMSECIGFDDVNQSLITWFLKSIMTLEEAGELRLRGMQYFMVNDVEKLNVLINEISDKLLILNSI